MSEEKRQGSIGTISHGTMIPEQLIISFLWELKELWPERQRELEAEYQDVVDWIKNNPDCPYWYDAPEHIAEDGEWLLMELDEALGECAPELCYFGAHVGDGSDFGFWPDWEAVEEMIRTGEAVEVKSLPEHLVDVNDHGNVSVYSVELKPVWDVV